MSRLSPSKQLTSRFKGSNPSLSYSRHQTHRGWRLKAHQRLTELLGITPELVPKILSAQTIWKARHKHGDVKKIHFVDAKDNSIPGYIGTPHRNSLPTQWIICLQGHTPGMHMSLGLDSSETYYKSAGNRELDIASQALHNGYGIVCIEQYSLGERSEKHLKKIAPHPCQDAAMHSLLYGHTLMGIRVAEVARIVEFLREQEFVSGLVGVAGNSLGGTVSMYSAALNPSIDFAVLSSCISTLEDSLFSIYHCTDLYIPRLAYYFDTADILGLIAPKPLVIVHGVADRIFPIKGFRDTYQEIQLIYSDLKANHHLKPVIGSGGHKFYGTLAYPALRAAIV